MRCAVSASFRMRVLRQILRDFGKPVHVAILVVARL